MSEETLWLGGQLISTLPGGHVAFMMMVLATAHVTGVEGGTHFSWACTWLCYSRCLCPLPWLQVLHHKLSEDPKYSSGVGGRGRLPTTALGDQLVNLGIWLASLSFIFLSPYRVYVCFKVIGSPPFWHQGPVLWKIFFHGQRGWGIVSEWFKHSTFIVLIISIIITSAPPQIIRH